MNKFLSLFITIILAFSGASPVFGESDTVEQINFFCEDNGGVLSTIAKNVNGEVQPLFHWKTEAFDSDTDLSQLCTDTTKRLNEYFLQNSDSDLFRLIPSQLLGLPAICITKNFSSCDFLLSMFYVPVDSPVNKTYQILNVIVDNKFRDSWTDYERDAGLVLPIELFK